MAKDSFKVNNSVNLRGQASAPSTPENGDIYYDSTTNKFLFRQNGVWRDVGVNNTANVGSSPNAAGLTITNDTINLQPADGSNPGVMLAGAQTLGGNKTWNGSQNFTAAVEYGDFNEITTSGSDVTLSLPGKVVSLLSNASLVSVAGITAPSNARTIYLVNTSGGSIVFKNESGSATAGNRIITGIGGDFTLQNGASLNLVYDTGNTRWRCVAGVSAGSLPTFTTGSVLFADGSGNLSQDNANFFWDNTSKRLGIGTNTPGTALDVRSSGTTTLNIRSTTSGGTAAIEVGAGGTGNRASFIDFVGDATYTDFGLRLVRGDSGPNSWAQLIHRGTGVFSIIAQDAGTVALSTNNTNRIVVQSDGNIAFIPTGAPNTAFLFTYNEGGAELQWTNGNAVLKGFIDYNSSIDAYRLWSYECNMHIGALQNHSMLFFTNGTNRATLTSDGHFIAATDNAYTLGASGNRWSAVWAANGTIQTSDERQKNSITDSDLGLEFIQSLRPVSYKWNVGQNEVSKDENGEMVVTPRAGVRTHYGLIAQEVKDVLGEKDFGGYIHDQETDHMGLRYDQFISPMIKAIQELSQKIDDLQQEIDILKQ